MTAERLREAAALMRARAEAATPSPWGAEGWTEASVGAAFFVWHEGLCVTSTEECLRPNEDAEHIASWHPAVTLAVADLLDRIAEDREMDPYLVKHFDAAAVTLADAYLGSAS